MKKQQLDQILPGQGRMPYLAMLLIGQQSEGKSYQIKEMLKRCTSKKHTRIFLFHPGGKVDKFYEQFTQLSLLDDDFIDDVDRMKGLYQFLDSESTKDTRNKKKKIENAIVMDDVSFDNPKCLKIVMKILRRYRDAHLRVSVFLSSQQLTTVLNMKYRDVFQQYMIFGKQSEERLKSIFEQLPYMNIDYKQFIEMYLDATRNKKHSFLYIDKYTPTVTLSDSFKYLYEIKDEDEED